MEQALLLNATYEPLKIINWQRAVCLLWTGKAEVVAEYERELRGVSLSFKVPAVVRLLRAVKFKFRPPVKFTRMNLFARDGYRCQYCGESFHHQDLTFDHVVPVSQGGRKTWENIVSACVPCNDKKAGRTPEEAGMHLVRQPKRPAWSHVLLVTVSMTTPPDPWKDYLYWHADLVAPTPDAAGAA